jgi:hypothetical protein
MFDKWPARSTNWPLRGRFIFKALAQKTNKYSGQEIGDAVGVHHSTLSLIFTGSTEYEKYEVKLWPYMSTKELLPAEVSAHREGVSECVRYLRELEQQSGHTLATGIPAMTQKFLFEDAWIDAGGNPTNKLIERKKNSAKPSETSSSTLTNNLPYRLPDFVGQKERLLDIEKSFQHGDNVILAGMGGIGKTSLAIEFAHRWSGKFSGGVFFADAQGMSQAPLSPIEFARLLAQAIDPIVQIGRGLNWVDVLRSQLLDRQCLVIMDNLWSADIIQELGVPESACVLATARKRLAVPGCQLIDVDEMSNNDALAVLRSILKQLDFDDEALEELSDECGALPLALRAAATYVLVHKVPIDQYIQRLKARRNQHHGQRLSYLSEAKEIDRKLDVEAVLSLSLEKLLEDNRALAFQYIDLVQFRGDFDSAAVGAIWEIDQTSTSRALDKLVAQSLVQRDHISGRLRIHDLLKEMAEGQLVA